MNLNRLRWRIHRLFHPSHVWGSDSRAPFYRCFTCARFWPPHHESGEIR